MLDYIYTHERTILLKYIFKNLATERKIILDYQINYVGLKLRNGQCC